MTRTSPIITARVPRNCRSGDASDGSGIGSTLTSNARSGGTSSCSGLTGRILTSNTRTGSMYSCSGLTDIGLAESSLISNARGGGLPEIYLAVSTLINNA